MAFRYKISGGKAAIYDKSAGDAPLTSPLGYLSRVKFHSDLDYIKVISVHNVTLSLPARSNQLEATGSYTLLAHGRPGQPFVLGKLNVNGYPVGFTGSVPVHKGIAAVSFNGVSQPGTYGRWLALGANATHVIVHEYCVAAGGAYNIDSFPAMSIPITVYITDELL